MSSHPIAITGMHRSGTSMVTRGFHDSGLQLLGPGVDVFIDTADDNPEGFWENKVIVACNDDLLEATGGAWDRPPPLPPQAADDPRVAHLVGPATAALSGLRQHDRWGFKDPRTCLTAAFWLDIEPALRFVVCVRHPLEVALSLKRRNQNSYSLGLALWQRYYSTVLALVPADRRIVTHYDAFFDDPHGELERLCEFVALEPAQLYVRADLRHHSTAVTLAEAGVDDEIIRLYDELCGMAGVAPGPTPAAEPAHVRRLVLDGAVARQHADQRQAAIDRLHEREAELRKEKADADAAARAQIRALEVKLGATPAVADVATAVADLTSAVADVQTRVARLDRRVARGLAPIRWVVTIARPLTRRLRRSARSVRRLRAVTRSSSHGALSRRALLAGRRRARPLLRLVRSRGRGPARRLAHRLPPPLRRRAQRGLRRVVQRSLGDRGDPVPQVVSPRGRPQKDWIEAYREIVARHLPHDGAYLVAGPSSRRRLRAGPGDAQRFPAPGTPDAVDDVALVAQLDVCRHEGTGHLVVPEGSRPWFHHHPSFHAHVTTSYRTIVDRPGAGAVYDLDAPADPDGRTVAGEVLALAAGRTEPPAVLDWTSDGIDGSLPFATTFRTHAAGPLPYLDRSVDIVVADHSRDEREAARVASLAAITVSTAPPHAVVRTSLVEGCGDVRSAPVPTRRVVLSSGGACDGRWRTMLAERALAAGAELVIDAIDASSIARLGDDVVVVIVEPHVLPLPGSVAAAHDLLTQDGGDAITGRMLSARGRVEAAGGTVFADRSVGLIAHGAADVRAPWHDHVRPVCWAPGLLAVTGKLSTDVPPPDHVTGRALLREWCADIWASGRRVVYRPEVTAVRLAGDGGEPSAPLPDSAWQRVLDLRPARPPELSDGAWRHVLGHDDVEACRA